MPLTTSILEKHDRTEDVPYSPMTDTTTPLPGVHIAEECRGLAGTRGVQEETAQLSSASEDPRILQLQAELNNLRADRDALFLALKGGDMHSEGGGGSFLPRYQETFQLERNDTTAGTLP